MYESNPTLAALVGSRLCHDLISPIGAIQNGLELLTLAGSDGGAPEMALIQESCASATARIRFFRVAFGNATDTQVMGKREIVSCLSDLNQGSRINSDWAAGGDKPRTEVQLMYLAYLCAESALPLGGTVRFEHDDLGWHLTASGPKTHVDATLWHLLENGPEKANLTPDKVQFALLGLLARERGFKTFLRADNSKLRLDLRPV